MASSTFVHESSYVDSPCEIGEGTKIWHFSHVMKNSRVGRNCNIGQNVVISPDCVVGNNVKIQNNVSVYTGVILEDDVFCGPSMVFTNVFNPRSHVERKNEYRQTLVKQGATIGANATVVCGNTLGRYCFVGAGSVVTRDVPDFAMVYGNPAKVRGWACTCGEKLDLPPAPTGKKLAKCGRCGQQYRYESGAVHAADSGGVKTK
jgi:UDP-2-acetamido-3-amino-2,3-dideoxy-glucuronate N-acetyltransferase